MARANSRQAAYRVAQKQSTSFSAPDPALQQYQHPNGLKSSEPAEHAPRKFPGHGEDVSDAVGAQNIEHTFAMVEEQMFRLTACWTLHCMPCRIIFNDAKEQAEHNAKWHWDNFLCFACDIGFETAIDLKKVSPRRPSSNFMSNTGYLPSIYIHMTRIRFSAQHAITDASLILK
ncbi:histone-lysine n-methyltransferase PRDM9 [Fusarium mexicanum]|uniref:Histone-lysine n-methyltransferase PRDM9 n=1 Tax=Fusarium mexicanum TaxID=751941 RepID=A0A8H5ISA8_9HYPO|nr:histone-lysine n-methyltransferase PRDM9 [Fusarium mexicanum]